MFISLRFRVLFVCLFVYFTIPPFSSALRLLFEIYAVTCLGFSFLCNFLLWFCYLKYSVSVFAFSIMITLQCVQVCLGAFLSGLFSLGHFEPLDSGCLHSSTLEKFYQWFLWLVVLHKIILPVLHEPWWFLNCSS